MREAPQRRRCLVANGQRQVARMYRDEVRRFCWHAGECTRAAREGFRERLHRGLRKLGSGGYLSAMGRRPQARVHGASS